MRAVSDLILALLKTKVAFTVDPTSETDVDDIVPDQLVSGVETFGQMDKALIRIISKVLWEIIERCDHPVSVPVEDNLRFVVTSEIQDHFFLANSVAVNEHTEVVMVTESVSTEYGIRITFGLWNSYLRVHGRVQCCYFFRLNHVLVVISGFFGCFLKVQFGLTSLSFQICLSMLLKEFVDGVNGFNDLRLILVVDGLGIFWIPVDSSESFFAVSFDDLLDNLNTFALITQPAEERRRWDRNRCYQ